jgi:alcohol dehydrogenase YqhD (iron-dependent ADH family)
MNNKNAARTTKRRASRLFARFGLLDPGIDFKLPEQVFVSGVLTASVG